MRRWLLLLTLLLLAAPAMAQPQRRLALVIGNQNYQHVTKLRNTLTDARAMVQVLEERGFEVTKGFDLDRRDMATLIAGFMTDITPGSIVVVYFSGHGVQFEGASLLLPVDIEDRSERYVAQDAFPLPRLMDELGARNQRDRRGLTLLIIDACRDNPFRSFGKGPGVQRGLEHKTGSGAMVLYAASANQTALDRLGPDDRDPNGVFTRMLLRAIRTPGLTVHEVAQRVKADVDEAAARAGYEQLPAFYDEARGTFTFTPLPAPPPPPVPPPAPAQTALPLPVAPRAPLLEPRPAAPTALNMAPPVSGGDTPCPPAGTRAVYGIVRRGTRTQTVVVYGGSPDDAGYVCLQGTSGWPLNLRPTASQFWPVVNGAAEQLWPLAPGKVARFADSSLEAGDTGRVTVFENEFAVLRREPIALAGRTWDAWVLAVRQRGTGNNNHSSSVLVWRDSRTGLLLQSLVDYANGQMSFGGMELLEVQFPP